MKKIKILSLFVGLLAILSACGDDDDTPIPVTVKTVLMYLVADNSISGDIYSNIASVEEGLIKATSPGTFVIYWDGGSRKSEFPEPGKTAVIYQDNNRKMAYGCNWFPLSAGTRS